MKLKLKSAITTAAMVAGAGGIILAGASGASAQGTPTPWAGQDALGLGGITFFDATGNPITSGTTTTAPFSAFAEGRVAPRAGDTKATLFLVKPVVGASPATWGTNEQIGLSTTTPNPAAPGALATAALPVNTETTGDTSLDQVVSDLGAGPVATGYTNVWEVRLFTGAQGKGTTATYDYADISIDPTAHTWTLVYTPDAPDNSTATTSTLVSSPTTGNAGDSVTLTDTIAPATAAGTVQFKNGSTNIGSPVTVASGVATTSATLNTGANNFSAVFTPTDATAFKTSTGTTTVTAGTAPAKSTTIAVSHAFGTFTPNGDGSTPAFTPTTLTASITPANAAGSVQFLDGSTSLGSATVSGGTATLTYGNFGVGAHSITAVFTPADSSLFLGSTTTAADTFTLGAAAGAAPDAQPITVDVPAGSLSITTPYTTANPLNVGNLALNAAGTELTGTASFGNTADINNTIKVVDTRTGGNNWTVSALSSALDAGTASGDISAENVGLTGVTAVPVAGNHLTAANVTTHDNAAADPAVAIGDTGSLGLGGTTAHQVAASNDAVNGGTGTIGFVGTLTVTAPTSIKPGHYTGTITFTVV